MAAGNRAVAASSRPAQVGHDTACLQRFVLFDPLASKMSISASSCLQFSVLHVVSPRLLSGELAAYAYYLPKWIRRPTRGCLCDCSLQLSTLGLDARCSPTCGITTSTLYCLRTVSSALDGGEWGLWRLSGSSGRSPEVEATFLGSP